MDQALAADGPYAHAESADMHALHAWLCAEIDELA